MKSLVVVLVMCLMAGCFGCLSAEREPDLLIHRGVVLDYKFSNGMGWGMDGHDFYFNDTVIHIETYNFLNRSVPLGVKIEVWKAQLGHGYYVRVVGE